MFHKLLKRQKNFDFIEQSFDLINSHSVALIFNATTLFLLT